MHVARYGSYFVGSAFGQAASHCSGIASGQKALPFGDGRQAWVWPAVLSLAAYQPFQKGLVLAIQQQLDQGLIMQACTCMQHMHQRSLDDSHQEDLFNPLQYWQIFH